MSLKSNNYIHKIAVVHVYFGPFPNFFDIWLQSCIYNRSIDFIIVTDNDVKTTAPNIKLMKMSFEDFKKRLQNCVNVPIKLERPYKLCDFKPLFGKAISDILQEYDFYGFCDNDMIFGDIRYFFSDDLLSKHDHLLGMGHFQLQRIKDENLNIAIQAIAIGIEGYNYEHVISHEKSFCADELPNGLPFTYYSLFPDRYYNEYSGEGRPLYDEISDQFSNFIDIYNFHDELGKLYNKLFYAKGKALDIPFWKRKNKNEPHKKYMLYQYKQGKLERIYMKQSKIYREEILYVHFLKRKFKIQTLNYTEFLVVPNKILAYKNQISPFLVKWYGYNKNPYFRKQKKIIYRAKVFTKKIFPPTLIHFIKKIKS